MNSECSGRFAMAISLCLLAMPALADPHWVMEAATADVRPGAAGDADCADPDSGPARFLSCRRPLDTEADSALTWAVGFDMPLTDPAVEEARWWAGFRLGRHAASTVRARLPHPDLADETLQARLSSAYALAQLRREWTPGGDRLRPYVVGGVGVARVSVEGFQRDGEGFSQQAPEGDRSAYLIRLETGVLWQLGDRLQLGLALRQDAIGGWGTPRGSGWIEDEEGHRPRQFAATQGRLAYRSVGLSLHWPLGGARGHGSAGDGRE